MNRLFLIAIAITLSAGAATSVFSSSEQRGLLTVAAQQNSAAYRDGMYLGKLDVENGRKPHLTTSRWVSQTDRSAFLAGYEAAYGKVGDAYSSDGQTASTAELMGFHDGMSDGTQHRQTSKQFQVDKTENFRHADRGFASGGENATKYQEIYRQAYANGYQRAYYGDSNPNFRELSQQASF